MIELTNETGGVVYTNLTTVLSSTTNNYSNTLDISSWAIGNYTLKTEVSDSHTAKDWGEGTKQKTGISYFKFDTDEKNTIRITSDTIPLSKEVVDKKDRKNFNFNYLLNKNTFTFYLESDNPIVYLPESKAVNAPHFVVTGSDGIRGNWIDFSEKQLEKNDYTVEKISDYKYSITVKSNGKKSFEFDSIGGLNVVENHYKVQIGAVVEVHVNDPILAIPLNFTSLFNGITKHSADSLGINTSSVRYINITKGTHILGINSSNYTSTNTSQTINSNYHNITINLYKGNVIDNCSLYNSKIITFIGKDEETNADTNMSLDITVKHTAVNDPTAITNTSFEFRNNVNYSICTDTNKTFLLDAIMDFGDGSVYTKKKYYLNNYTANSNTSNLVYLYHLNNTKASEIVFTVFDTQTGTKVSETYIKILRYYPGENVLRTVEIAKTDENGQSLGKMVLADVFYKFILEKPAGTVKLTSDTLRVLSLTRSFGISFVTDYLDTWDKVHGISTSTTCTKGTNTCRVTWSDTSNIVQDVTLEVWRMNGLSDVMISSQTSTAAAGTISYTITEDTTGNSYEARSYVESNTGTSNYFLGLGSLFFSDNPFFTNTTNRTASLFPLMLLVLVIVFALLDFGVIGVIVGSLAGLLTGSIIGILPLSPMYFISFILITIILIYKLSK